MKRLFLLVFIGLFLFNNVFSQEVERKDSLWAMGIFWLSLGNHKGALKNLFLYVGLETNKSKINLTYISIGDCYKALKKYKNAIKAYSMYADNFNLYEVEKKYYDYPIRALSGRVFCQFKLEKYESTLSDLHGLIYLLNKKLIDEQNNRNDYLEQQGFAHYLRGVVKHKLKIDKDGTCKDWSIAEELGNKNAYKLMVAHCLNW